MTTSEADLRAFRKLTGRDAVGEERVKAKDLSLQVEGKMPWLSDDRVQNATKRMLTRQRHVDRSGRCAACKLSWPCEAILYLNDLEKTEESFMRLTVHAR